MTEAGRLPRSMAWRAFLARSMVTEAAVRPLFRSVVYTPGSNVRAMRKIKETPVDGVILDLEDAVAPDSKAQVCVARSGTLAD